MSTQQSNLESSRSVKANEQRLKSLDEYEREKQKKKRLIKESLSASQNRTTHFKFDSDDEDGGGAPQPKKFAETKIRLFDDSETPNVEEHFQVKKIPKKQKKLRDLQARLTTTSDPRFQFSENFLDDHDKTIGDDEDDENAGEKTTEPDQEISFEEEKKKSLAILDQITSARTAVAKPKTKMIRFDPSKTEHRIYELESQSKPDGNHSTTFEDHQSKSRVKQSTVATPVMDSTRTYNFDQTKLKSMFEKSSNSTSTSNGDKQFQFQFFSNAEMSSLPTPKPTPVPKPISNGKSKMFLNQAGEVSSDDENNEKTTLSEEAATQDQIVNDTFFFFDIDSRLKDGLESFIRTEDLNELERTWPSKRKEIGEALRAKHRKAIQRKDKHRVFNHRQRQRQQPLPNPTSKSEAD